VDSKFRLPQTDPDSAAAHSLGTRPVLVEKAILIDRRSNDGRETGSDTTTGPIVPGFHDATERDGSGWPVIPRRRHSANSPSEVKPSYC
jgi:hypothetical protein